LTAGNPVPPLAVAPFATTQSKVHQKAWADYLDMPKANDAELIDVIQPLNSE